MKLPITLDKVYPVTCHTDHVGPGSTFVAIKGLQEDGIAYIPKALTQGASKIIIQQDAILTPAIKTAIEQKRASILVVENVRKELAYLAARAANFPASKLRIIAVTGTKGKTTTTFLVEHLLKEAGYKTALLSTVKNRILDQNFPSYLTTAQPDYLNIFFNTCLKNDIDYVIMEVAAQAATLHRVDGLEFDSLIFTNFGHEHAEFYNTPDTYFAAKASLCKQLKPRGIFVLNRDDERVWSLQNQQMNVISFGMSKQAVFSFSIASNTLDGLHVNVGTYSLSNQALLGKFNAYNIVAAVALACQKGIESKKIEKALATFTGVPGRLERFQLPNGAQAFIDYAHNPSSFQAIFTLLRPLSDHVIAVFGTGGDRDKAKRPIMGTIASTHADIIILTTDNPRSEDPKEIIKELEAGIPAEHAHKVHIELDREKAIRKAYALAKPHSILALLGKGAEEYQLVQGVKISFNERAILRSL